MVREVQMQHLFIFNFNMGVSRRHEKNKKINNISIDFNWIIRNVLIARKKQKYAY